MALKKEPEVQKSKSDEGVGGKNGPEAGRDGSYVWCVADVT